MKYVSADVACQINKTMIETYSQGELVGVKEPGLLDSAINRPLATMFGKPLYEDLFEKATALFELNVVKKHSYRKSVKS